MTTIYGLLFFAGFDGGYLAVAVDIRCTIAMDSFTLRGSRTDEVSVTLASLTTGAGTTAGAGAGAGVLFSLIGVPSAGFPAESFFDSLVGAGAGSALTPGFLPSSV